MPASAAQVFGPITIDPDFTTTGEKTLLTMNTTLPAGGKNVIIVSIMWNNVIDITAKGTLKIYKGSTLLYGSAMTAYLNYSGPRSYPAMLIAVDSDPNGNDSYSFVLSITTAGTTTGVVHVQGIVIKTDDAVWRYNTTAVSVVPGDIVTITSISTAFTAGSKVAIIATVYGGTPSTALINISGGSIKIKSGTTVISSNQSPLAAMSSDSLFWTNLIAFETTASSNQTYSVEFTNSSSPYVVNSFAEIVAFSISDGVFLDTDLVGLSNGVQVTVGNLSTTLTGNVVVIGLAAVENMKVSPATGFNAGDVVLQLNNSATGQMSNLVGWSIGRYSDVGRSGVLPLFRIDIGVTNPSYQIKMTARADKLYGEAKILAFVLFTGLEIKKVFGETVREIEGTMFGRRRFRISGEIVRLGELGQVARNLVRRSLESINLIESVVRSRIWVRIIGESEGVSEEFRGLRSRFRHVSESLGVSEASARIRRLFRVVAENVSLSEAISRARIMARVVGEVVRSLEAAIRARIIARVANEVAQITEALNSARGKALSFVEGLRISEAVRHVRIIVRSASEQMRISEALSKAVTFVKVLGEALDLSEAFKAGRDRFRSVGESLGVSELAVSFKGAVRVVGEALNLGELSQVMRNRFRQVEEAIDIGEAFARFRVMVRVVLEPVAMLENQLAARLRARAVDEIVNVGETLVRFKGKVLDIVEVVVVTEIRLFKKLKVYIDRLASTLKGMSRSTLKGMSRSRLGGKL